MLKNDPKIILTMNVTAFSYACKKTNNIICYPQVEKDNACDRVDVCEEQCKAAKVTLSDWGAVLGIFESVGSFGLFEFFCCLSCFAQNLG